MPVKLMHSCNVI